MKSLGRYILLEEIGHGSMGVVYRASDPLIERTVAVKTVNLAMLEDSRMEPRLRFLREAKAAGRLSHPGIVTIYDVGEFEDVAFIVMELIEGVSLNQLLERSRAIALASVVQIIRQAAEALAYAHRHGVVHRDIKPGNVMLARDGGVKIADFGIARIDQGARTRTGILVGSPRYMSPEQLSGHAIDGRSDVFSLGSLMYQLITGHGPFDAERPEDFITLMQNIVSLPPAPMRATHPSVPAALDTIVLRALQKDPAQRYATAQAMAAELAAAAGELVPGEGEADIAALAAPSEGLMPEFDLFAPSTTQPLAGGFNAQAHRPAVPLGEQPLISALRAQAEAAEQRSGADSDTTQRLLTRLDVERRMRAAFAYYQELVRYLGIVKPAIDHHYELPAVGAFPQLRVADALVDSKLRREDGRPWMDAVLLTVVGCSPTDLQAKRAAADIQPVVDAVSAASLRYSSTDSNAPAGDTTLLVPGEITIYVRVLADRERGRIGFLCRNVAQFGVSNFVIDARAADEGVFEEFAKHLLGRPNRFLQWTHKG